MVSFIVSLRLSFGGHSRKPMVLAMVLGLYYMETVAAISTENFESERPLREHPKSLSCLFLFSPVACRARSACGCALVNKCSASTFQEITHYTGRQRIIRAKSTRRASRLFTGRRVTTYKTTIWIAEEEGEQRRNLYSPAAHPRWAKRARLQIMFFSQSSRQFVLASLRSIR